METPVERLMHIEELAKFMLDHLLANYSDSVQLSKEGESKLVDWLGIVLFIERHRENKRIGVTALNPGDKGPPPFNHLNY